MKMNGGYTVPLYGVPRGETRKLPLPDCLYLPVRSRQLHFTTVKVHDGDRVCKGQVLAIDEAQYGTALVAPLDGTICCESATDHIIIKVSDPAAPACNTIERNGPVTSVQELLSLGAWHLVTDAFRGKIADPAIPPDSLIVSASTTDPFFPDPEVLWSGSSPGQILKSLEYMRDLAGDCRVYLVVSRRSRFSIEFARSVGQYSWLTIEKIPGRYPLDNPQIVARSLVRAGAVNENRPAWHLKLGDLQTIVETARTGMAAVTRVITIAGPAASRPVHAETVCGYPLQLLLQEQSAGSPVCVINGGAFNGTRIDPSVQQGLDLECKCLTLIREPSGREVLPFANPGFSRHSYSRSYLSILRPSFRERPTTSVRGEYRPCISCGFCEEVCPAGLLPFQLRRYAQKEMVEELVRLRIDLCVECGLCTYVCPSKCRVSGDLAEARRRLIDESTKHGDTGSGEKNHEMAVTGI